MNKIINCDELNELIDTKKKVIIRIVSSSSYLGLLSQALTERIVEETAIGYGIIEKCEFERYLTSNKIKVNCMFSDNIYLIDKHNNVEKLPYFCGYKRMLSMVTE